MPPSSTCIVHSTTTSSPIFFQHYITSTPAPRKHQLSSFAEKHHVRFNPHVTVRAHIHLQNYTDEEYEATFYTEAEYAVIKLECREIVLGLLQTAINNDNKNSGPLLDTIEEDSPSCHWGLERMLNGGLTKKRRHQAIAFVMEEQDRQWYMGTEEPEMIVAVYSELSELCQAEAHRTGLRDQQDQEEQLMVLDDYEYDYDYDISLEE